jgi:hypothetical protein
VRSIYLSMEIAVIQVPVYDLVRGQRTNFQIALQKDLLNTTSMSFTKTMRSTKGKLEYTHHV